MAEVKTTLTCAGLAVVLAAVAGCARSRWPDPPAIDQAQYQKQYEQWRAGQQETARDSSKILGVWPLENGDTPARLAGYAAYVYMTDPTLGAKMMKQLEAIDR